MALSDFLTEGREIPAGSGFKATTSQTVLPDWYTNYAMDILSGQKALSAQPYQTYQGPRVAGFNPTQELGFNKTVGAAGAYQPQLGAAVTATKDAMGKTSLSGAMPYFTQAAGMNPLATASGDYGAARGGLDMVAALNPANAAQPYFSNALSMNPMSAAEPSFTGAEGTIGRALGYDSVGATQPYYSQAAGMSGLGSAQPYFGGASDYALQSTKGSGLEAADPYLRMASGNVADVSDYMNPYQDAVVNRIADLGTRNLQDNIMPALEGRYITSGQFRGSGQLTDTMRAVRDTSNDILGQQSLALQQGYGAAQQAKTSDLNRYGQLGSTAGGLAAQQQQILANAGRTLADIGIASGNLTQQQQQILASMGTNLGNLTQGQQSNALAAAGQLAGLGSARAGITQSQQQMTKDIGASLGGLTQAQQSALLSAAGQRAALGTSSAGLTQQQQQILSQIGQNVGSLSGADISRNLSGAAQLGSLAGLAQQYGLTGANAISGVGNTMQAQQQKNLDVAYSDFLRQQGYPQEQIDKMLTAFKGVAQGVPSAATEYGIVPTGQQAEYKPGTASQIAAGLTAGAGILDVLKGLF